MTKRCEKGQALLVTALTLTVLMLSAGLAIDMGYLRYQRRLMQTAADSAAIAGATQLNPFGFGGAYAAAFNDSALNGFGNLQVTQVQCPDGTSSCIQVVVSQVTPLFFMRILPNLSQTTVSATAVAETAALGCMYALSNAGNAIQIGLNSDGTDSYATVVAAPGCNVVDNGGLALGSDASHKLDGSTIVASSCTNCVDGAGVPKVSPSAATGAIQAGDPLAYLSTPSAPPGMTCSGAVSYIAGQFQYPCGLIIDPTSAPGATITLASGAYSIGGPGLTIQGSGTVTGAGVTFYIDNVNGPGAVNINPGVYESGTGTGTVIQLQAPASGPYSGVLLFQDRGDAALATVTLGGFNANPNSSYLWGALYLPDATLTLNGVGNDMGGGPEDNCSTTPRLTVVVANQLIFHKNLNFSTNDCVPNWPPGPTYDPVASVPSPINDAVLVK